MYKILSFFTDNKRNNYKKIGRDFFLAQRQKYCTFRTLAIQSAVRFLRRMNHVRMGDQEKKKFCGRGFIGGCALSNCTDANLRSCREGAVKIRRLGCCWFLV